MHAAWLGKALQGPHCTEAALLHRVSGLGARNSAKSLRPKRGMGLVAGGFWDPNSGIY